jgi:hypothetical protein
MRIITGYQLSKETQKKIKDLVKIQLPKARVIEILSLTVKEVYGNLKHKRTLKIKIDGVRLKLEDKGKRLEDYHLFDERKERILIELFELL